MRSLLARVAFIAAASALGAGAAAAPPAPEASEGQGRTERRRDAALASGAQVMSTELLTAPNVQGHGYHAAPFAGGWRCNAVVRDCTAVEHHR